MGSWEPEARRLLGVVVFTGFRVFLAARTFQRAVFSGECLLPPRTDPVAFVALTCGIR